jgi:hypothetical protein
MAPQTELAGGANDNKSLSVTAPDLSPDYEHKQLPRAVWDFVEGDVIEVIVGRVYPTEAQKYYAKEICHLLNTNYHHDGRWQVTWTEPAKRTWMNGLFRVAVPQRLLFSFYLRPFGDPKDKLCFDYILDEDFENILMYDPKEWMQGASSAVEHWLKTNVEDAINGDHYLIAEAMSTPTPGSTELKQIEGKEEI